MKSAEDIRAAASHLIGPAEKIGRSEDPQVILQATVMASAAAQAEALAVVVERLDRVIELLEALDDGIGILIGEARR